MRTFHLGIIFILFITISCTKFRQSENQTVDKFSNDFIEKSTEIFTIDNAEAGFELVTEKGVRIVFEANSLLKGGTTFTGTAKIEFVGIFDRVGMMLSGIPTVYRSHTGELELLKSGGEIFLNALDEGSNESLQLSKNYRVDIPKSLTFDDASPMYLFVLEEDQFWNTPSPGQDTTGFVEEGDSNYIMIFDRFGWLNCDAFADVSGPKELLMFQYPEGFNEDNALVFLSLESFPFSLARLHVPIPIGEKGHVIMIARTDDFYHVAHESFTVESNWSIDFSNTTLESVPAEEIESYLAQIIQ